MDLRVRVRGQQRGGGRASHELRRGAHCRGEDAKRVDAHCAAAAGHRAQSVIAGARASGRAAAYPLDLEPCHVSLGS